MIDLYYFPTPNGKKIKLALEEMGLDYTIKEINITKDEQFDPAYLKISPNNKIPAIVDQDGPNGETVSIFESGAILQYLGRKTGQFYPAAEKERIAVEEWLMWQMGGLGPMLGQNHHFTLFAKEKVPYAIERYQLESQRLYGVLDKQLAQSDYVAGEYSIADMAILPWILNHEAQGIDLQKFLNVQRYIDRLFTRKAVQEVLEVKS